MMSDETLITLRDMAWERAKGELYSMLRTYWSKTDSDREFYNAVEAAIDEFINKIEEDLGI